MADDATLIERMDLYVQGLFATDDALMTTVRANMTEAGLPHMAVSASEASILRGLVHISGARRILEIGTLGGYSAIQMAHAMKPGGKIVTLELSGKHADVARKNIALAGLSDAIEVRLGPAEESLKALQSDPDAVPFDLVFIDADKPGYPLYLDLAFSLVRPGGLILSDNTLTHNAVDEPNTGMGAYNTKVAAHPHLASFMLPVLRGDHIDGLLVSIKKG